MGSLLFLLPCLYQHFSSPSGKGDQDACRMSPLRLSWIQETGRWLKRGSMEIYRKLYGNVFFMLYTHYFILSFFYTFLYAWKMTLKKIRPISITIKPRMILPPLSRLHWLFQVSLPLFPCSNEVWMYQSSVLFPEYISTHSSSLCLCCSLLQCLSSGPHLENDSFQIHFIDHL